LGTAVARGLNADVTAAVLAEVAGAFGGGRAREAGATAAGVLPNIRLKSRIAAISSNNCRLRLGLLHGKCVPQQLDEMCTQMESVQLHYFHGFIMHRKVLPDRAFCSRAALHIRSLSQAIAGLWQCKGRSPQRRAQT
jgi:hypothetical protein